MKLITIKVSNEELDAFEDYITCEQKESDRQHCVNLWSKLVHAYDESETEALANLVDVLRENGEYEKIKKLIEYAKTL